MQLPSPTDWATWRVLADRLLEQDDPRGELLHLEFERLQAGHPPEDDAAMRALLADEARDWLQLADLDTSVEEALADHLDLLQRLPALSVPLPDALEQAVALAPSQLLPFAGPELVTLLRTQLNLAMVCWIEQAFDGVPPPGLQHLTFAQANARDDRRTIPRHPHDARGRWQDIPDSYLLDNQWGLAHLDGAGMHYYLPAILRFGVLHRYPHFLREDVWLTESLEYALMRTSRDLRDLQRSRMARLNPDQRAVLAGFCWLIDSPAMPRWVNAAAPGEDWFERYLA